MERITQLDDLDIRLDFGNRELNMLYVRHAPALRFVGLHAHSGYELHYNVTGDGHVMVNGRQITVRPGVLYITGPDVFHEQVSGSQEPMGEYCINLEVLPGKKGKASGDLNTLLERLLKVGYWQGEVQADIFSRFEVLWEEMTGKETGYMDVIRRELEIILIRTFRQLERQSASAMAPKLKNIDNARRLIIDLYFQDNLRDASCPVLAEKLGMSERQLNRVLHQYFGTGFAGRVQQVRQHMAEDLLQFTRHSVAAVAEKLGYHDSAYFCRVFKAETGVTPGAWRRMHQQEHEKGS